jgi:DNA-binding beta-propeller fold protein YncE
MDVYQPVGIGSDFLGYRIEELIGRGGMGVVYRAHDLRLKRPVALKLVAPSLARDEQFRERFARESELVMSLEHPNVVPIYDAGDVDGRVYLAMRLVDGTDLRSLLRAEGALEPERAIAICTQIAAALDAAHARGLVHRDVKPSNVLLDTSGHVYLADFGLTRTLDDERSGAGEDRAVGTPAYLAPEQLEGLPADGRSDVYSLGCLLYECLTGEAVFPRDSRLAVAWAHLEEEPPRASGRRAGLPKAVDAVIARSLAKEPEQRFGTCGALVGAARHALGLEKVGTSRRRQSLLLAGAVGLAVIVAGVVFTATLGASPREGVATQISAGANTLARIDPVTEKVSNVFHVGTDPVVTAAGGDTVWVYSRGSRTITQINAITNRRVETTPVSPPAECCSLFTGPVLAASDDMDGAWFIEGGTAGVKPSLVHVWAGRKGKRTYPLPVTPTGVAAGGNAVWVVGYNRGGDEVLRIDPQSGSVTAKHFPASARIDSIVFGYGKVWVLSSRNATLYKIDTRTAQLMGQRVLAHHSRAERPEILHGGDIWVGVVGDHGAVCNIRPSLSKDCVQSSVPPGREEYLGQQGSLWWYDAPMGIVSRQEWVNLHLDRVPVTRFGDTWLQRHPAWLHRDHAGNPKGGGPCLTSMVEGVESIWVTVAPLHGAHCTR